MNSLFHIIGLLAALSVASISAFGQSSEGHRRTQFPHPLNATMGIPDPVGSYNVRVNGFRQVHNDETSYDVSGHLSYGMFEWGGLHLRSLGVRTAPFTEIIGMVGLLRNESRTQGVSLLGIVGVPTGKKNGQEHHGLAYLAGVTGRLAKKGLLTNDIILHYDFSASHLIAETGSVIRLTPRLFATLDARGTFGDISPDISLLSSLKMQVFDTAYLALGYHTPVTNARSFAHQLFVQLEIGSH